MDIKIGTTLKCIEDTKKTKKGDIVEIKSVYKNRWSSLFSTNKDYTERYHLKSILGYKDSIGWHKKFVPYPKHKEKMYCRCFLNHNGLYTSGKVYSYKYKEILNTTYIEIITDEIKEPMYISLDIFETHFDIIGEKLIMKGGK